MARRFLASGGNLDEHIAEAAKCRNRPRISFHAERRFHLADKSLGRVAIRSSIAARRAKDTADQLRTRFDRRIRQPQRRWNAFAPPWGLSVSSCCACASSPRSSNCSRQRCGVSRDSHQSSSVPTSVKLALQTHRQIQFAHLLAVAQQTHQRSMAMYVRFVQRGDFAVRIVPRTRTVERERHRTVRQHREFAV